MIVSVVLRVRIEDRERSINHYSALEDFLKLSRVAFCRNSCSTIEAAIDVAVYVLVEAKGEGFSWLSWDDVAVRDER